MAAVLAIPLDLYFTLMTIIEEIAWLIYSITDHVYPMVSFIYSFLSILLAQCEHETVL